MHDTELLSHGSLVDSLSKDGIISPLRFTYKQYKVTSLCPTQRTSARFSVDRQKVTVAWDRWESLVPPGLISSHTFPCKLANLQKIIRAIFRGFLWRQERRKGKRGNKHYFLKT